MGATVTWVNPEKTIILLEYTEPTSIEDVVQALDQSADMLDAVSHQAYLIVNMTAIKSIPRNVISYYPQLARSRGIGHPNVAIGIAVVDNAFLEMVSQVFSKVYGRFAIVSTMQEAMAYIAAKQGTP